MVELLESSAERVVLLSGPVASGKTTLSRLLADRFGFSRLYDLARRKHPKLYPGQLLYSMREFDSLSRGEFDLDDCEWQRLGTLISAWRVSLRQLSAEHDQPDPTRFPELGW